FSSSFTLTSPKESEFEAYLEKDSIPPGIDLTLPPTLKVSSSNPTSPTLTGEKGHSWKMSIFFSLVRFVWTMMKRNSIRKKIICLLATYLHQKTKPLSCPQEVEEIKIEEDKVSSDVPINTIVMPIRITFDNPIDFNDHFSKPKDLKRDLTVALDSTESSILPPPLLDSDSPFIAELSASITLNSLRNEDKERHSIFATISDRVLPFCFNLPKGETLRSISCENEDKVFNPGILWLDEVHYLTSGISHRGLDFTNICHIAHSSMEICPFSHFLPHGEEIHSSDVPFLHFYPHECLKKDRGQAM
ncbi:hypothetical protein Tco_1520732, partial [Tanacetum coccineum]